MTFSAEIIKESTMHATYYVVTITAGKKHIPIKYFKKEEVAERYVEGERYSYNKRQEEKCRTKQLLAEAKKSFVNPYKVGDVLYNSWGYEQTNIDWFQVVGTTKSGVKVRRIARNFVATGPMQGEETPVKDQFISEKVENFRITVCLGGTHYMKKASVWSGVALHSSSYA